MRRKGKQLRSRIGHTLTSCEGDDDDDDGDDDDDDDDGGDDDDDDGDDDDYLFQLIR